MEHSRLHRTIEEQKRTIEEQNRKLETYHTKLRDVVQAYKDLSKEKAALEATVAALSQSFETSRDDTGTEKKTSETKLESIDSDPLSASQVDDSLKDSTSLADDSTSEAGNQSRESTVEDSLRQQIATLSTTLVTMTQQKSKLETSSVAERKKFMQELDEKEKNFQEERENLLKQIQGLEGDLEQWRNKVRSQQHEQERERNDYAVMMRELQQLLTTERIAKVNLETQIEDLRLLIAEGQQMLQQKSDLYERTIFELRQELEVMQRELKTSKESSAEPSSLLLHLQKELMELKDHEKRTVFHEQQRANEAEARLLEVSRQSEERVADLEAKISEFAETLGTVERLRNQDQQTMQKLRDRIVQLDVENAALASASHTAVDSNTDENLDVTAIIEKMLQLKDMYITASEKDGKQLNLYEALQLDLDSMSHDKLHKTCHEQYEHIREEFERYKLRAQSVLKNKNSRETGSEQEVVSLKSQTAELRERLVLLRRKFEDQELQLKDKDEYFSKALASLTESHKTECAHKEADHKQKLGEMDTEMRRHRERTIALLAEKDREITSLRFQLPTRLSDIDSHPTFQPLVPNSPEPDCSEVGASSEEVSAVAELLRQGGPLLGISGDTKLLHFAQEQGRREVEIATLRRQKHNLEMAVREQQQTMLMKEQEHMEEVQMLQEVLKKHERDKSRESANLEYLKNVIHHYLMSSEHTGRLQMLNAITTILEFSPKEKQEVHQAISRGWWNYKHSAAK